MSREEAMSAYITEMKLVAQKVGRGYISSLSPNSKPGGLPPTLSVLTPIMFPVH